jgi:DNA helicase-2/ATP-dependent DNA helicase PcrA
MRRLDPAQKAAATGKAPIQLTLAGPGSGKTSTLTGRFVHLIRQGVDPSRILAMTFTKKAADDMRRRIARLLELPSPVNLHFMTFHAFAFRLLKRNPGAARLPERFQLWGTPEQRRVFTSRQMWWNEEVDILEIIGGAKERLLDPAMSHSSINSSTPGSSCGPSVTTIRRSMPSELLATCSSSQRNIQTPKCTCLIGITGPRRTSSWLRNG